MRRLVTGKQMKEIDAYAIQTIGTVSYTHLDVYKRQSAARTV